MKPNSIVTEGVVLARTNFGEADRILTVITPDHGKVRLMAKGVRKSASKLAGGIELFSTSYITYIKGKGDLSTLISTRLIKHYGNIVKDLDCTQFGYAVLKIINRATEDNAGPEYYGLLKSALEALDHEPAGLDHTEFWLYMQLLKLSGHSPNLGTDSKGQKLAENARYSFDLENMSFVLAPRGRFGAAHIKLLRLGISLDSAKKLAQVNVSKQILHQNLELAKAMLSQYVRI
jgi:DNA repair protein RecO